MKSIRNSASRAVQLFEESLRRCRDSPPFPSRQKYASVIGDLHGRFLSWCGNLGARQHGHASLDWRLRDSDSIFQRVLSHIDGVVADLEECLVVLLPNQPSNEESGSLGGATSDSEDSLSVDDHPGPDDELEQHLLSLKRTMDNLYKLSFLIRNPKSRQSTLQKAESYGRNFDGHGGDIFEHLEVSHRNRAAEFVRQARIDSGHEDDHLSSSDDANLLVQLSQASSKRQRQFAYWEKHSKKLSAEGTSSLAKPLETEDLFDASRVTAGPGTSTSGTEATALQAVDHDVHSVAPSASTARGLDGMRVPMPKAPKVADGQTEFACPYCYVWCPASERDRWRKHLFEDVRPYMCTFSDCPTAGELYATRMELLSHEKQVHLLVWRCKDHPSTTYKSQADFEDHMKSHHISLTDREIEASTKYSQTTAEDMRDHCHVCLITVPHLLHHGQTLANHVAHHFEAFARPSFPDQGGEDDDIESDDGSTKSIGGEEPAVPRDADLDDLSDVTPDDFEDASDLFKIPSIHALAVNGNKYAMRAMLEDPLDVNLKDDEGWTALQRAAYAGHSTISQMLLGAGADVNHTGSYYGSALQCAATQGHDEILRSLIDSGANVNQEGGHHGNALLAAVRLRHTSTVSILLDAGANSNLSDPRFIVAIQDDKAHGRGSIGQMLIQRHRGQGVSPPWTNSAAFGGEFIYDPRTDEIVIKSGQHFARPRQMPAELLGAASHDGPLQFQYASLLVEPSQLTDSPPWTNSRALGGEFIYNPQTDEIVMKNGQHFERPRQIPVESLKAASYDGPLQFQYTASPPEPSKYFSHGGDRQQQKVLADRPGASSPSGPADLPPGSMARGRSEQSRTTHQLPTDRNLEVVFNARSSSQVARREPTRTQPPPRDMPGITIGDEIATSALSSDFKTQPASFFVLGRVFLVLWSEPTGRDSRAAEWEAGTVVNLLNERVYPKVRRFIVIRPGQGDAPYCTALPIITYSGRGVAMPGVNKSEHCIIHTSQVAPAPKSNELPSRRNGDGMRPIPIRVDPDFPTQSLDEMSRLGLASPQKVQHSTKCKSFGKVNDRSVSDLLQQFDNVWHRKPMSSLKPTPGQASAEESDDEESDDEEENDQRGHNEVGDQEGDGQEEDNQEEGEEGEDGEAASKLLPAMLMEDVRAHRDRKK